MFFYGLSSGGLLFPYIIEILPPVGLTVVGLGNYFLGVFVCKYCVFVIRGFGVVRVFGFFCGMCFFGAFGLFGVGVDVFGKSEVQVLQEFREKKFLFFVSGVFVWRHFQAFFKGLNFFKGRFLRKAFVVFFFGFFRNDFEVCVFGIVGSVFDLFFFVFLGGIGKIVKNKMDFYCLERNFYKINKIFWRSMFLFCVLIGFLVFIVFTSNLWLSKIGIKNDLVETIYFFSIKSIPYLILEGINYILYKFISSFENNHILETKKILNLFLFPFFLYVFIVVLNQKALGFIYAKFFVEFISFFTSLYFFNKKMKKFISEPPKFKIITKNILSLNSKIKKNILKKFRNLLILEINTYWAILLFDLEKLTIWMIFKNFEFFFRKFGKKISKSLKKIILKEKIKNGIRSVYNKSIVILIYSIIIAFFFFYLLTSNIFFLVNYFFENKKMIFIFEKCFQIYSLNIFSELVFESFGFLLEFNNFRKSHLWINGIFYPLLSFISSPIFCFFFGMEIQGLVLSITFVKFLNVSFSLILLFYFFNWKKNDQTEIKEIEMNLL